MERMKPQPPLFLLLGLEPVQSCLGVARVMSEQKVLRSVEQRIVIKFAEIHHRLQQHNGEECLHRRVPVIFEPPCIYVFRMDARTNNDHIYDTDGLLTVRNEQNI